MGGRFTPKTVGFGYPAEFLNPDKLMVLVVVLYYHHLQYLHPSLYR